MLFKLIHSLWPNPQKRRAAALYITLVAQARNPFFYAEWKVADSVDGRFDLIVLHLALITHALEAHDKPRLMQLRNALMEYAIEDMDRNLREMGVSDTSVSKKMKKLASALNGRFVAYRDASDAAGWQEAIARNIYRSDTQTGIAALGDFAKYAMETRETLAAVSEDTWLSDSVTFGKTVPSAAPENIAHSDAA